MKPLTIVLFKNDLRIHDNPALYEGVKTGNILPIYIKPTNKKRSAKAVWIDQNLKFLQEEFKKL